MNNVNHNEDHVRRPLQDAAKLETLGGHDSEMELRPKINNNCNGGKAPDTPQEPLRFMSLGKPGEGADCDGEEEDEEVQPPPDNGASFLIILFFYFQVYFHLIFTIECFSCLICLS